MGYDVVDNQLPLQFGEERNKDLDFTGVESPSRAIVPAGVYSAVVKDVVVRNGRDSGEPYLHIYFSLTDPGVDGTPVQSKLSFAPKAKPWTKLRLEVILGEAIPATTFPWPASRDRLIGRLVRLKLQPTEYQGVRDMEVKVILPPEPQAQTTANSASPTSPTSPSGDAMRQG